MRMGIPEWVLLICLSLVWGGAFFFSEIAVDALPSLVVALCRTGFAAVALLVLCAMMGQRLPTSARLWGAFVVMGALNNAIPFSLILWGQTHIAGGLAAILNATTPLFTVVAAHVLTRDEKLTVQKAAGVALGIAGVAVMVGADLLGGLGDNVLAQLAVLAAAVSYACASIYGRRFAGVPPMATACGQLTASSTLLLPVVLIVERPWTLEAPSAGVWAAIAGLALVSTALAYVMYFRILARAGATNLALVTFLIPPGAIILGAVFLGEVLEPKHFTGLGLIALGLACIDGRLLSLLGRRASAADA